MKDEKLGRLERQLLEAMVFADRAQTAMRCFLITHQGFPGVSDLDEYLALRDEERRATEERHDAFLALVHYEREHGLTREEVSAQPVR
jgi:hypothetical protein